VSPLLSDSPNDKIDRAQKRPRHRTAALWTTLVLAAASVASALPAAERRPTSPADHPASTNALFGRLDLARPDLARVRILVARKEWAAARRALKDHFRQRRVRVGFWPIDRRSIQNPNDIAEHRFSFYGSKVFDAGRPIRWNAIFLGDRELTYALNRHQHLLVLASAYRRTHDPKFARAFVEQVRDWIARNGTPDRRLWAAWRPLEVAIRIGVWSDVFFQFLGADEFSPDDVALMLLSLHDQAAWLAPRIGAGAGGWSSSLPTGLAAVAVLFPEFKESAQWRGRAYSTLISDMKNHTYADGSDDSLSPHHQNANLTTYWLPFKLAVENRVAIPSFYSSTLEKMCTYQAYIRRPDGRYPAFNASDPMDCLPLLLAAAKVFKRPDLAYITSHGRSGSAPTSTSCAFRPSGVFVMRDNWSRTANYLALDAGPFGRSGQHEDKLSFELAAFGRTAIVDPGRYSLNFADPLTRYLATTAAHNTLTVDGRDQCRARASRTWDPGGNAPNCWISRKRFDYFAGGYVSGYEGLPAVRHYRRVFFLKDNSRPYWIVSDRVIGRGKHHLSSRFQFAPAAQIARTGGLSFASRWPSGNLAVCPPERCAEKWTASVLEGSRSPLGGWVSPAYGKILPAPQLIYDFSTSLSATMEYVLVPFRGKAHPPRVAALRPADGDVTRLEIDFGDFMDIVFIDHNFRKSGRNIGGLAAKGCFVVVRKPKRGAPKLLLDEEAAGVRPPASEASAGSAR